MNQGAMPAYPYTETVWRFGNEETVVHEGMTKREVFAMAAMQGILANQNYEPPRRKRLACIAKDSVHFADALIAALSDQPTRQEDAR